MTSAESPYGDLVDTTLRAMTWNVWGRFGPWEQRERAITAVLRASAPDIVLLQECWCDDAGANQAARLGELLDMHHCFSGGNAILSRWPTTDVREHALPALDTAGWGGLALRAAIEGPRRSVLVYCVALDCPPAASLARQHSLRHLAGLMHADVASVKAPLVVGGDFNAGPGSDEIRMLTGAREPAAPEFVLFDAWTNAAVPGDAGLTWSRSNMWAAPNLLPDQRIDYLFTGWPRRGGVGSAVSAWCAGMEAIDGVVPSDHYAVVADVRY